MLRWFGGEMSVVAKTMLSINERGCECVEKNVWWKKFSVMRFSGWLRHVYREVHDVRQVGSGVC